MIGPFRLAPYFSPRPWGTLDLAPWYAEKPKEPIGEAWLTGKDCVVESGRAVGSTLGQLVAAHADEILSADYAAGGSRDFPLLLKLLFPRDKLSVQVHPNDAIAQLQGEPRGKTECWYVLSAQPGARIALGLRPGTSAEAVRKAVANQTLEQLLDWLPVFAGDMIYVDAGTVHSIGPGVVLLETQQYSDLTYRLYDFGRPRELHLELAIRALKLTTAAGKVAPTHRGSYDELIRKQYFIVERHVVEAGKERRLENVTRTVHSLVALSGSAMLKTRGAEPIELLPGRAVVVPAACVEYTLVAEKGLTCIRAMPPGTETSAAFTQQATSRVGET
jgi:mannose-6-phosphate isomerase